MKHQLINRGGDEGQAVWNNLFTLLFIDQLDLLTNLPNNLFEIYKQGYILLTTQAAISCEDVSLVCYPNLCKITIMKPTLFLFFIVVLINSVGILIFRAGPGNKASARHISFN
jgi:hypothetical protein